MTNKEAIALQTRLDDLTRLAEEISALTFEHNKETARKFRRIARYARDVSTCVRLHGKVPLERELPTLIKLATQLHRLSSLVPATVDTVRRGAR